VYAPNYLIAGASVALGQRARSEQLFSVCLGRRIVAKSFKHFSSQNIRFGSAPAVDFPGVQSSKRVKKLPGPG
jgi:hypothetical protein